MASELTVEISTENESTTTLDLISKGIDPKDPNTICGLLNRLTDLIPRPTLSDEFAFFPVNHDDLYEKIVIQEVSFWPSTELDYSRDRSDYENLSPEVKRMIDYVNAFFSATDGLVNTFVDRLALQLPVKEVVAFCRLQMANETVHAKTYGLIINTMVGDPEERQALFRAANDLPCVRNKDKWIDNYMTANIPVEYKSLVLVLTEGVFFTASFIVVFYIRSLGLLPSVVFANEQISKDEGNHRDTWLLITKKIPQLLKEIHGKDFMKNNCGGNGVIPEKHAIAIVKEAVELEHAFVDELLPKQVGDFKPQDIKNCVCILADDILLNLGYTTQWNLDRKELPSWFSLADQQKMNFYEGRVGNYVQSSIAEAVDWRGAIEGSTERIQKAYVDPSAIDF